MSLMCAEIRNMSFENLHDAVYLVKESSRGMSLEYDLDTVGFLTLSRFWNFCYDQSLLVYVNHEPAGIAIHCTDPARHEAYTYYWGVLPKFRSLRLSLQLAETCARKLRERLTRGGGAQQQTYRQDTEQQGDQAAKDKAELLARHREDEIGMGVGNAVFDGAGAIRWRHLRS